MLISHIFNHRGFDIIVPQKFLKGPNILAHLLQMGSKGMRERDFSA
jgi:hypothetical protein